jgi:hypothetical protein
LQVDKSPDLIYVRKSDYLDKIKDFLGPNFEQIAKYLVSDQDDDVESYRTLIDKTFKTSLPKKVLLDMHPFYSISDFYGMFKCLKKDQPIRGIVTSYNSLVCNSEDFLKTLIEPIVA